MNYNKLTPEEENVIINKGTERPFTGKYYLTKDQGTYVCKRCNAPLYHSSDKFESSCGWPSFDDEIKGAVKRVLDADGHRTEIICAKCGAHLGHVFEGEGLTPKNIRHCVNSISMNFIPASDNKTDTAIFAGGCFWGVEYFFQKEAGVISTEVGYIGGHTMNPSYKDVCGHNTGHAEAARIIFDPEKTSFEKLARLFFEIHDPTQMDRQGPDVGDQYRSEIFYMNPEQKEITEKLIKLLKDKGFKVVTKLTKATTFWKAEDYHQQYYEHKGNKPYCHGYTKRF
ncbi:MAG: bifunctional methionine sulfoxide reductase B/A protein [Bacteroidetes bacterium]|nr:bifunctional methionine sulfoxide reductase B/A protein [Bacteroidota bacterium]